MITIDLFYLMEMLLPPLIRQQFIIAFLSAVFKPLDTLQAEFYTYYSDKKYELTWNSQVIMLEHLLNDQFDNIDRGIYIEDAEQTPNKFWFNVMDANEETYLFNDAESEDPYYLNNTSEYDTDVDFIVNVPTGVVFSSDLMKYFIDKYRCAGKRYLIVVI